MKFVLNEIHRDISDNELLEDVKSVAQVLKKDKLTIAEYQLHGKYSYDTVRRKFGSWNNVLMSCGLTPSIVYKSCSRKKGYHLQSVSSSELLEDIQRVAKALDKETISCNDYDKYGQFSSATCIKRFSSWKETLVQAKLSPYIHGADRRMDDRVIFEEIERIWILLGRQPTSNDIRNGISTISLNTYIRHFGSWRKTLEAFVEWVNKEDKDNQDTHLREKPIDKKAHVTNKINPHTTQRDINLRLRFLVMKRDNFKCYYCGASPANDPSVQLHVDHIIPWSKGGETTIENLRTSCSKCNLGKSDLSID